MPTIQANADSVRKWEDYDGQTAVTRTQSGQKVDHWASAGANAKQVGKDVFQAFDPTNRFRETSRNSGDHVMSYGMNILLIPWNLMAEIGEFVGLPLRVVKDASDAAVHAVKAGVDKIKG